MVSTEGAALATGLIVRRLLQVLCQNGVLKPHEVRNILAVAIAELRPTRTIPSSASAIEFINQILSEPLIKALDKD